MPKRSAGILVYRRSGTVLEVLLVHPGGPFWAKKEFRAWSIPKGEHDEQEDPFAVAQREFQEETGSAIAGDFMALTPVRTPGGKRLTVWAVEGDLDAGAIVSNEFEMEWPPRSGRRQRFPEVDRAAWFPLAEARERVHAGMVPLLDELARKLDASPPA
jgi:predicted NUDIX family NTP pyrophosphohydrolase